MPSANICRPRACGSIFRGAARIRSCCGNRWNEHKSMRKPSPQLLDLLAVCSPGVTNLALALRELVLSEAPEAEEVLYSVYAQVIVFKIPGRKRGAFCGVV